MRIIPASPKVAAACPRLLLEQLRIYPQPDARRLRQAIAEHHNVSMDSVVVTHAGDEALRLAITTFVPPNGVVASTEPTYSLYPVLAQIQGASMFTQGLSADWSLPNDFAAEINAAGAQLTCVVNPHAPSGYFTAIEQLRILANDLTGVLLVDEAYADFVDTQGAADATELVRERDNVLILRTFRRATASRHAIGLLARHPSLIQPILEKTRDSYNVDAISQAVGLASIQDQDYARQTWASVRKDREVLATGLRALGFSVAASQTNFLLAQAPDGADAEMLYQGLKAGGILVRYFNTPRLSDSLRITVGTPDQNARLLSLLETLLKN